MNSDISDCVIVSMCLVLFVSNRCDCVMGEFSKGVWMERVKGVGFAQRL